MLNADDPQVGRQRNHCFRRSAFRPPGPPEAELSLEDETIMVDGEPLIEVGEMQIIGRHNVAKRDGRGRIGDRPRTQPG